MCLVFWCVFVMGRLEWEGRARGKCKRCPFNDLRISNTKP